MPRQLCGERGGEGGGNVRKGRKWSKMEEKGRRQVRKWKGEGKEQKAHCQPTSHPVDPIFFKRPAHSSRPDSLTIIKRKSFYSAVSFHCSALIFLPPTSASTSPSPPFLEPSISVLLPRRYCSPPPPPSPKAILLSNYSHLLGKRQAPSTEVRLWRERVQNVSHLISSPVTDSGTTLSVAMEERGKEGEEEAGRKEGAVRKEEREKRCAWWKGLKEIMDSSSWRVDIQSKLRDYVSKCFHFIVFARRYVNWDKMYLILPPFFLKREKFCN